MAINLTEKFTEHVDEMFTTESKKALVTNRDYNWTGAHTIKVHKVNTVGMNDYDRLGTGENSSRYGALGSVENTLEEFTLRKDLSHSLLTNWTKTKRAACFQELQRWPDNSVKSSSPKLTRIPMTLCVPELVQK